MCLIDLNKKRKRSCRSLILTCSGSRELNISHFILQGISSTEHTLSVTLKNPLAALSLTQLDYSCRRNRSRLRAIKVCANNAKGKADKTLPLSLSLSVPQLGLLYLHSRAYLKRDNYLQHLFYVDKVYAMYLNRSLAHEDGKLLCHILSELGLQNKRGILSGAAVKEMVYKLLFIMECLQLELACKCNKHA